MESEAAEEEAKDKEIKADLARKALKQRIGSQDNSLRDGTISAPSGAQLAHPAQDGLEEIKREARRSSNSEDGDAIGEGDVEREVQARARASEFFVISLFDCY